MLLNIVAIIFLICGISFGIVLTVTDPILDSLIGRINSFVIGFLFGIILPVAFVLACIGKALGVKPKYKE